MKLLLVEDTASLARSVARGLREEGFVVELADNGEDGLHRGSEAPFDYCGLSCVVGPDGADLARAGSDEELIFADIEPATMEASRRHNPYLTDRRPELYSRLSIRDDAR